MEVIPSSHQRSELSNTILCIFSRWDQRIGEGIPIHDSMGEEATFINICISNGNLKCHRVLISLKPSFGDKVICWYTGFTFRHLYSLSSFSRGIPILTVQECQTYSQFHNCNYLSRIWLRAFSSFLILPEELHLRVPNRTSIIQDWAHKSFITCHFTSWGQDYKLGIQGPKALEGFKPLRSLITPSLETTLSSMKGADLSRSGIWVDGYWAG